MKTAISIAFAALVLALVPYKEAVAQNPQPCASVQNSASAGQVLSAKTSGRTPACQWVTGGGGGGGVTSITLRGTTNQITVTGTCTITSTGTCTFSIPSDFRLPGTINKITLTQPATGATITLADAKTFTVSKTLTLDGTDGMTITFPAPAGVTDQHCAKLTKTGTNIGIADAGANCQTGTVTSISTTSPITGGTITSTGTIACATCVVASSPGAGIAHFAGSTQTVTSSAVSLTADVTGLLPAANMGAVANVFGSGTITIPSGNAVLVGCSSTCSVPVPVPAAGYQICVKNNAGVSTVITLSALGSSAMYPKADDSGYGTAGTGTMVSSAAAGNKVCLIGRDATHYELGAVNASANWTVN